MSRGEPFPVATALQIVFTVATE